MLRCPDQLVSRILYALAQLPRGDVFPWFAAVVWAVALWLFEHHRQTLQPSLHSSLTYLYHDSNCWTILCDFLLYNG